MKKSHIIFLAALALAILVTGCTTFKMSGIQVIDELQGYDTVGTFDVTIKVNEFLGTSGGSNLFNATSDAMENAIYDTIRREIQKFSADAAVNVTVTYQVTFVDMLLNSITGCLYAPATAHITGTLVKYD